MAEPTQEEKMKKVLETFDWSSLFRDEPKSFLAGLLPWLSVLLEVVILLVLWKK